MINDLDKYLLCKNYTKNYLNCECFFLDLDDNSKFKSGCTLQLNLNILQINCNGLFCNDNKKPIMFMALQVGPWHQQV